MKKEHLEILLEDIRGKFELVLEGHSSLREEMRRLHQEGNEKHEHTALLLRALGNKIDGVAADLTEHRRDTEAHRRGWRVKEGE
jgi:hypothetical protein